jgi:Domain of unknown function (DUF4304)
MDARSMFLAKFKSIVSPILKEEGFRGSGNTWRRQTKEVIHVINVQGSIYGGQACVCLGIHLDFFPIPGKAFTFDPKKIKEPECAFRSRLRYPDGKDTWWQYGNSEEEAQDSALDIRKTYLDFGRSHFNQFHSFPDDFTKITPETFPAQPRGVSPPTYGKIWALLAQARIYHHLGNREYTSRFSEMGLANLGKAVGLKAEFERLRTS